MHTPPATLAVEAFAPAELGETRVRDESGAAAASSVLDALRARSRELGFARIGIASADQQDARGLFEAWIAKSYHGSMKYLQEPRLSPAQLLPGAKSVIVAACSYGASSTQRPAQSVAAYAEGPDYHHVLKQRLRALAQTCADLCGPLRARVCVDTAPLLERDWARNAGVGFTGKSTLTIVPGVGSAVLLGELILDVALPASGAVSQGCGECTACLTVCPTGAFVDAYVLDARRCISYLTIESRDPIPQDLRAGIGTRLFGCDECQRVCPFNASRKLPERSEALSLAHAPEPAQPDPTWVLELGSSAYRRWVQGTAKRRTSRAQLQRNAAVALGNRRDPKDVPSLVRALTTSPYPLVRGHVAWALGRIGGAEVERALEGQLSREHDASVRGEIETALSACRG